MNWGKRKSDNQSYVKKPKKSLSGVIGSTTPQTGKVKFAKPDTQYLQEQKKLRQMELLNREIDWAETMIGKLSEPVPEDQYNMELRREQLSYWKKRLKEKEDEKKYKELENESHQPRKRSWW